MNFKKKFIMLALTLTLTLVSFFLLVIVEGSINRPKETSNVYILTTNKHKGDTIEKKDYVQEKVDKNLLVEGAVTNENELKDKVAVENISKNEQLTTENITFPEAKPVSFVNPTIYCLKVSDIGDAIAGKLRSGDRISLITTQKNNLLDKMVTSVIVENAYVDCVYTENGTRIEKNDSVASAVAINLYLNADDAMRIDNAVNKGIVRILKIEGKQTGSYKDFRIESVIS